MGERVTPKEHALKSRFAEEVPDLKALFLESPQIYPSLGKQTTSTSHLCRGEKVKSAQKPKSQPQEDGRRMARRIPPQLCLLSGAEADPGLCSSLVLVLEL